MGTKGSSVKMKESIIFRICSSFKKKNIIKLKNVLFLHTWLRSRFPTEGNQKLEEVKKKRSWKQIQLMSKSHVSKIVLKTFVLSLVRILGKVSQSLYKHWHAAGLWKTNQRCTIRNKTRKLCNGNYWRGKFKLSLTLLGGRLLSLLTQHAAEPASRLRREWYPAMAQKNPTLYGLAKTWIKERLNWLH